jgi:membrane associated rhomboid family serine protease
MILPIRTDSPLRSRPWMNWAIIAATLAMGVVETFTDQFKNGGQGFTWVARYFELSSRAPSLHTFVTYAFVHVSWLHLLTNLLPLYIFGNNINDRLGHVGYLAFYLAGAVFAGVGFVMADASGLPVIGASGAVMAVMGAYLALYPRSNITILSLLFFVGTFEVPSMYLIIVFFVLDLIGNLAGSQAVAHVAHIAGLLFGFGVGMALLWLQLLPRDPFDFLALVQRWNRRRQYKLLVRQGYNPFAYAPPAPTPRSGAAAPDPDPNLQRIRDLRAEINEAIAHHNLPHAAILFLELQKLDPRQVLARQAQLDVANQLASQQFYHQAADAYEQFLRHYPNFEQIEQVELMLGIVCARYLRQYDRAKALLSAALHRLHGERETAMARSELERIQPLVSELKADS